MSDDLVERVARAIDRSLLTTQLRDAFEHPYTAEARAAIAVVLEQAAKVAETYHNPTCNCEVCYGHEQAAAAIRALGTEPADG